MIKSNQKISSLFKFNSLSKAFSSNKVTFNWEDPLNLQSLLTSEEAMVIA